MRVIIRRIANTKDGVFGVLVVDGMPICLTLEEEWLNNQRKISCIPAGSYKCVKYSGTKYKDVWLVQDVPNRSAILIHWGNTKDNTAGCILVGQFLADFPPRKGIANSLQTYEKLRKILPDKFTLEIKDHFQ